MSENALWIRIGSGRAAAHNVGGAAALLDRAARAGLNVPPGVVILDTVWDQAVLRGLLTVERGGLRAPDPARLLRFINLPAFNGPVTLSPTFGPRATVVRVADPGDPAQMIAALTDVWASALRALITETGNFAPIRESDELPVVRPTREAGEFAPASAPRRDLILMAALDAPTGGLAFTQRAYEDDLIRLTASPDARDEITLPKLRGWERHRAAALPTATGAGWEARLCELLREVRRWVAGEGADDWAIQWADDGARAWLLGIAPLRELPDGPPTRAEHFAPPTPRGWPAVDPALLLACEAEVVAYFRRFAPDFARQRPLLNARGELNIGLIVELLRGFGLPTAPYATAYLDDPPAALRCPVNRRRLLVRALRLTLPRLLISQMRLAWTTQRRATALLRADAAMTEAEVQALVAAAIIQLITFERPLTFAFGLAKRAGLRPPPTPREALRQALARCNERETPYP